jgi:hypothetical protein
MSCLQSALKLDMVGIRQSTLFTRSGLLAHEIMHFRILRYAMVLRVHRRHFPHWEKMYGYWETRESMKGKKKEFV